MATDANGWTVADWASEYAGQLEGLPMLLLLADSEGDVEKRTYLTELQITRANDREAVLKLLHELGCTGPRNAQASFEAPVRVTVEYCGG
jgi:hypothetical protein